MAYESKFKRDDIDELFKAVLLLEDEEDCYRFFEEFSDRILYGCDICAAVNTFPFDFDAFLTSMRESGEISEENYRKIVRENAVRLLSL